MPSWAVPAAHHRSAFALWLRRVAFYWRSELTFGVPMTKNNTGMLQQVRAVRGESGSKLDQGCHRNRPIRTFSPFPISKKGACSCGRR
jgi:hypothetical protein